MKLITGQEKHKDMDVAYINETHVGQIIKVHGMIHNIRRMNEFSFIILRGRNRILQCVADNGSNITAELSSGDSVILEGTVAKEPRAPGGFELKITSAEVLSHPEYQMPGDIAKRDLKMTIDTLCDLRPIAIRNLKERACFKIQEGISQGFREFMIQNGFAEIHTPKIVAAGAEGGLSLIHI